MLINALFTTLAALAALLFVLALLLLVPGVSYPVVALAKLSQAPGGVTVLGTVAVVLAALLASSVLELRGQTGSGDALDSHHARLAEAQAVASGVLAASNMLLIFILRKLALNISALERVKLSERFLVKQSENLRAEYNRLHADKDAGPAAGGSEAAALRARLDELQAASADLQGKLGKAEKARSTALANADALQSQAKGLEAEYDRLLAENDELKRRLSRADPSFAASHRTANKKSS